MLDIHSRMTALEGALAWAKIEVQKGVASIQTAVTMFQNDHFVIKLGVAWLTASPAHQYYMLLHEYNHIVRGDLTPVPDRKVPVWNIASDAVINHSLQNIATVEETATYVHYPALQAKYPALPMYIPTTCVIYNELCKHQEDQGGACYIVANTNADRGALDQATTRAIVAARDVKDVEVGRTTVQRSFPMISNVHRVPMLNELLRYVREVHTQKKPVRSYMREGRVGCLKGVTRKPRPSVAVALDVSGSIGPKELEQELAIVNYLTQQGYSVRRYVFATVCQEWPGGITPPNVGSSTQLAPVIERTRKHAVLVLLSDGMMTPIQTHTQHHIWVGPQTITQHRGAHVVLK